VLAVIGADEVAVAAVGQRLVFFNEAMLQQMQQAVVDRVHAIARADRNQTGQHGEAPLADAAANAVVHRHDLGGQHAAIGVDAR